MREIKFRAWDKNIKVMHDWQWIENVPQRAFWTASDLEIQQYTGLKDKNGKEIYEGDIVKTGIEIYEIKFGKQRWEENFGDIFEYVGFNFPINKNIEVIGNIYENPELKKQ